MEVGGSSIRNRNVHVVLAYMMSIFICTSVICVYEVINCFGVFHMQHLHGHSFQFHYCIEFIPPGFRWVSPQPSGFGCSLWPCGCMVVTPAYPHFNM